jgi:hypothetical protein
MSEPENFLSRWSRRKRVAEETPEKPAPSSEAAPETPAEDSELRGQQAPPPAPQAPPEPAFDPASLPSIDSIGAQTDITAFLKPGVPGELRLAALRRAWSADPAIRDFKGLAENDWDFNDPNGMLGFGELDASTDVKKMLAQLFGETPRAEEQSAAPAVPQEQPAQPSQDLNEPTERAALDSVAGSQGVAATDTPAHNETRESDKLLQREENIAVQDDDSESGEAQDKRRRSQGSALPH